MQKLYCYVDESGQETKGDIFVVSIAIVAPERDALRKHCEEIERVTGKGIYKWHKANYQLRLEYIRRVLEDPQFTGILHYSVFHDTRDYELATITGIARAVNAAKPAEKYTTLVYIDGLPKSKRQPYGAQLRKLGIPTRKVQGVSKEENDALIRLVDAVAGFIRDVSGERSEELQPLFEEAKKKGLLIEV